MYIIYTNDKSSVILTIKMSEEVNNLELDDFVTFLKRYLPKHKSYELYYSNRYTSINFDPEFWTWWFGTHKIKMVSSTSIGYIFTLPDD